MDGAEAYRLGVPMWANPYAGTIADLGSVATEYVRDFLQWQAGWQAEAQRTVMRGSNPPVPMRTEELRVWLCEQSGGG